MTAVQVVLAGLYLAPLAFVVGLGLRIALPGKANETVVYSITALSILSLAVAPYAVHAVSGVASVPVDPLFGARPGAAMTVTGQGPWIAAAGNLLALAVLTFARRYLHRETGFARFACLYLVFVLGFDLVAVGSSLDVMLTGWVLVGLASTFLIGFYGDRSSARRNAVFAFAAYRVADVGLLFAGVALHHDRGSLALSGGPLAHRHAWLFAAGLVVAAICKSSQFPLTSLFARSMEGPTPTSALGYAGLSAHIGVVLLERTRILWWDVTGARAALVVFGVLTALHAHLVASTRADRKGALGYATAGSVGVLFVLLGAGLSTEVLVAAFGHAALRIVQVLRAPSALADAKRLHAALGGAPSRLTMPFTVYRVAWALRRFDHDLPELVLDALSPFQRREGIGRRRARPAQPPTALGES